MQTGFALVSQLFVSAPVIFQEYLTFEQLNDAPITTNREQAVASFTDSVVSEIIQDAPVITFEERN